MHTENSANHIPLCVSFERRSVAREAGAIFDGASKGWYCDASLTRRPELSEFLPYRYRPDRSPPFIRPWMVPQPLWGMNLRALLAADDWKRIAKDARDRSGSRCRICGGRGPQWPVEADEGWAYDDRSRTQTLKGVIALCPDCHAVRHWGRTLTQGHGDRALTWMARINGWTAAQAQNCVAAAMQQWQDRSRFDDWRCDISWATRIYGVTACAGGESLARHRNAAFVATARAQASAVAPSHHGYLRHLYGDN